MKYAFGVLFLLVSSTAFAQLAGVNIQVVCLGPRGAQEACPGESVTCTVKAQNFGSSPLLLVDAGIVVHGRDGDTAVELTTTMPAGVSLPNDQDSASLAFVFPAPAADAGTRLEAQGVILIQNLDAPTAPPAQSTFPMFLDVAPTCVVALPVARQALGQQCRRCRLRRVHGIEKTVCSGCSVL